MNFWQLYETNEARTVGDNWKAVRTEGLIFYILMPCYVGISAHQLLHSIGDRREKHARPRQSQRHMLMLFVDIMMEMMMMMQ